MALIPRYNRFDIKLPTTMIPSWLRRFYTDVFKDADIINLYQDPVQALQEGITGIELPGLHMKLVEQTRADAAHTGSKTYYYPRGLNNMRILDDNEFALEFRQIDGFLTYFMIRDAVDYQSDDEAQSLQSDNFKTIGSIVMNNYLSPNYRLETMYKNVVYSGIDGTAYKYNQGATENTFTVRCKFMEYETAIYYKDKEVARMFYNRAKGN